MLKLFGTSAALWAAVSALGSPVQSARPSPTGQETDTLPRPFLVGRAEMEAGNPLPKIATLLKMESQYNASRLRRYNYWDTRAFLLGVVGDIRGSLESTGQFYPKEKDPLPTSHETDSLSTEEAVKGIVRAAGDRQVVMLGEEHHKPQTRVVLEPLLRELYKKGFRYLAAETFEEGIAEAQKRGYLLVSDGTYTVDPIYATAVRTAIQLGYKLVPYESMEAPPESVKSPAAQSSYRDMVQARHLKERIFDKDPKAKVIVWAGRAHVSEEPGDFGGETYTPMAAKFKELTGIDPFTVYLVRYAEGPSPEFEDSVYRYVTARRSFDRPTVFRKKDGALWGEGGFDTNVFFPRTRYVNGRPDWLMITLGRRERPIPASVLKGSGYRLVQVFREGEPERAVPVDQILLRPDAPVPALLLPKGQFWVRVVDGSGAVFGPHKLKV
jgi:hypothetical protein